MSEKVRGRRTLHDFGVPALGLRLAHLRRVAWLPRDALSICSVDVKRALKGPLLPLAKRLYLSEYPNAQPGSAAWLVGTELKYGGRVTKVRRDKVSPLDPRTPRQLSRGGMSGGDRMLRHGYAHKYSEYLLPYVESGKRVVLTEVGILEGSGLATWCELFGGGRIIGLDIDLGHIHRNMERLRDLGAFELTKPELYEFDQFLDNREHMGRLLQGDRVDICIDDGFHSDETVLGPMTSVFPHLADRFVYFVEDNRSVHKKISARYPKLKVDRSGALTIVSR